MDLQADIKWIMKELQDVKDLLKSRKKTAQQPERINIEQYNKEIDEALEDIKAGRVHTHQEVKEMIHQWGVMATRRGHLRGAGIAKNHTKPTFYRIFV